jgi:hypothetical protein
MRDEAAAVGLTPAMLLLSARALALDLSPSQLEALGKVTARTHNTWVFVFL